MRLQLTAEPTLYQRSIVNVAVGKIYEIENISSTIYKVKKLCNLTSHSWKINRELLKHQKQLNKPERKIPSFSPTRRWSLLRVMEVVVEQHSALVLLLTDFEKGKYADLILSSQDLDVLNLIIAELKPFEEISIDLSGESYVTASLITPIVEKLTLSNSDYMSNSETQVLTGIGWDIKQNLCNYLQKRYKGNNLLKKITFMHPRFHTFVNQDDVITTIKSELLAVAQSTTNTAPVAAESAKRVKTSKIAVLLGKQKASEHEATDEERVSNEVQRYLSSPRLRIRTKSIGVVEN